MTASVVIAILVSGFFTGALARLAIPGPDPMPIWLTLAIGLAGSIVGAVVARALFHDNGYVVSFGSLFVAIGLVAAYRRYVQHRPIWGPGAVRFPERGLGVDVYRDRLRKLGVDPDALIAQRRPQPEASAPAQNADRTRLLEALEDLHRAGVLDDAELAEKRRAVDELPGSGS